MKTFGDLVTLVRAIETLISQAEAARKLPDNWAYESDRYVRINAVNSSLSNSVVPAAETAATMLHKQVIAEMRRRGEVERDKRLSEITLQMETWRVLLPQVAASACIHLGVQARALSEKAPAA